MASIDEWFVDLFADPWYDDPAPSLDVGGAGVVDPNNPYDITFDSILDDSSYKDFDFFDPSTYATNWDAPSFDVDPADEYGIGASLKDYFSSYEAPAFDFNTFDPNDPYGLNAKETNDPYGIGESLRTMGLLEDPAEEPGGITGLINLLSKKTEKGAKSTGEGISKLLENPLAQLLLWDKMSRDKRKQGNIPIGQEAYGGSGGQDNYFVKNLIPALMPGVAYANVGGAPQETDLTPAEIGMRQGGIAGLSDKEGPGDVTLARLEPGEFVMTRKATQNIGVKNLYDMMRKAERMR